MTHNPIYPGYIWRQAFDFPEGFFQAGDVVRAEFRRFPNDTAPLASVEGGIGAVIEDDRLFVELNEDQTEAIARGGAIAVVRTTRAELITAASAGGLIPGEPYLIMDEGRLAWAISTTEFRATVTQDDLEGFTFFSQ